MIDFNPLAHDPTFYGEAFGWTPDPAAVEKSLDELEAKYGTRPTAANLAPKIVGAGAAADDAPVFFWQAEEKCVGRRLGTWNQKSVGACVGFGCTRAAQDLLFWEIAAGEAEQYPGTEGCPEATYAGSRVEVGGGRIGGDGSIGAWAAKFLEAWGYVARGKYGTLDLTEYNEARCRSLGDSGLPTALEEIARQHPVKQVAQVTSGADGWKLIGAGKPVAICSNRGFSMQRNKDGTCTPTGQWNHCMTTRGRYVAPNGRKRVVIGNSWGDYLGSENNVIEYVGADGNAARTELPAGHFGCELDVWHGMLAQNDSFAYAGFAGWEAVRIDYNPLK
jgi:hypothetical protein